MIVEKILKKLRIILNKIQMLPFGKLFEFFKYQKQYYTIFESMNALILKMHLYKKISYQLLTKHSET